MTDHVLEWMKKNDVPITREAYLDLAWGSELPDPWTPEHEAELPEFLQQTLDSVEDFDPDEPRDLFGKWTSGGGSAGNSHPGAGYSAAAYVDKGGVIHTSNVYDAQRALFENRKVELKQVKQVSTLIKRLGETAAEMAEHGEKAPVFNLCNVSVAGTNLFCSEHKGIPRAQMPVIPAKRTKEFIKYLQKQGYDIEKDNERAANLRASQSEISGAKVATQMERIRKEGFFKRLVVSKDDYILDGHHTWAGQLGIDAQDNNLKDDKVVKIARVDISIIDLIKEADKWTKAQGIAKKPAGQDSGDQLMFDFNPNQPRAPAGTREGGQWSKGGAGTEIEHGMIEANARAFVESRDVSARQQFLSAHPAEELSKHTLLMNSNGTVGISIDPHGDIQNVFNNGGPKGGAAKAMVAAIEHGGRTLDCYDGFLPSYYGQFGFKEVQRMHFNPQFAPQGWDFAKYDNPDIVFMAWGGYGEGGAKGAIERAASRKDWVQPERTKTYGDDWDAAKSASRAAAGGEAVHRGTGEGPRPPAEPAGSAAGTGTGESAGRAVEKVLLVSEQPSQEKLDRWNEQIIKRQDELNQQGQSGEDEDNNLNGMQLALSAFSQEDQKNLDAERSGLNTIYDGDNKLLAAAFTDIKGNVAKIAYFGAIDKDAQLKALDQVEKKFGDKVASIQVQRWKDDPSLSTWKEAGFDERAGQAGLTNLSAVILEKKIGSAANPPTFEHVPVPVEVSEGTGTDFRTEVANALTMVPERALKAMAKEGIKIRAGERMTQLNPELKGVHPRGWSAGTTWDSAEGSFSHNLKAVNVTEFYRPVGQKEFKRSGRIQGVVLHESGHAFDFALGGVSATSPAFIYAYTADRKGIPKEARRGLRYFLQKGKSGRSETFAETFAWHGGAGSGHTDIRPFFPRVSKLVKDAMDRGLWLEPIA